MTTFTLEPQENDRLQSLCGAFDENIKLIEKEFNLNISRNNFTFTVKSNDENPKSHHEQLIDRAAKLIQALYVETAPIKGKVKELDLEDVHIALQESRMLSQEGRELRSENHVYSTTIKTKRGLIKPRGENQIQYLHNILTHDISFGIGPAGTGKTFLAVAAAVEALERQEIRRILLTRPAVEAGENLGFLPGDLQEKVDPYLRPLYDALQEMFGAEQYEKLMERGVIEVAPLAYMRGRTLSSAFIILDEAQNTTREQMKMFLTRMGEGSKAVVTGDATQVDLPRGKSCGLTHAAKILKDVEGVQVCMLSDKDVVRHPLVMRIVKAYEKDEEREEALAREREEKRRSALSAARGETLPEADGRHKGENVK